MLEDEKVKGAESASSLQTKGVDCRFCWRVKAGDPNATAYLNMHKPGKIRGSSCEGCKATRHFRHNGSAHCPATSICLPPICVSYCQPQSALPPLELAVASRVYCRLQSFLPPPELTAASRACCRLQSLLPRPKLPTTSRTCYHIQS